MKIITLNNIKLMQALKVIPVIRIAIMLIVAVLSFKYSGVISSALALFFTTMLFALQIVFFYKYNNADKACSNISFYSYVPAILVMLAFTAFNLLTKRELLYSLTISLSLSVILLPRNKSSYDMFAFIINKKKYLYSHKVLSCKDILKCKQFVFDAKNLFTKSKLLCSISTAYSHYNCNEIVSDIRDDYAVEILKEFASVLNINIINFTSVEQNTRAEYDYYQQPQNINGLTYAVLNNKDGYRLIACGNFELIFNKCSSYADKNLLSDLLQDKNKLINSISSYDEHSQLLSFAFCDLDEFDNIDSIDNMIYIGSLMVKDELSDIADSFINDICIYNYPTKIICDNDNLKSVIDLIDSYNFNYTVVNTDVLISDFTFDESDASHFDDNKIIYKDNTYSKKDTSILFGELKENAKCIIDSVAAIENKINVLSYSIIITFLLATMLIPNNVMQPCVIVMILSIVEIISIFAVDTYKTPIKTLIINTFIIAFSALSVFFAGRFLVDAQMSIFDKESVDIARTMLVYYYILLSTLYDSLTIFSESKKHISNIIIMFICILLIYILNLPVISGLLSFKHLTFEAIKYIVLFTVIPVLMNIILATINNRKVTKNG